MHNIKGRVLSSGAHTFQNFGKVKICKITSSVCLDGKFGKSSHEKILQIVNKFADVFFQQNLYYTLFNNIAGIL